MESIVDKLAQNIVTISEVVFFCFMVLSILYLIATKEEKFIKFLRQYYAVVKKISDLIPAKIKLFITNKVFIVSILFLILLFLNIRYFELTDLLFSSDDPAIHLTVIKSLLEHRPLDYYFFPNQHYILPVFWGYYVIKYVSLAFHLNYFFVTKLIAILAYTIIPINFLLFTWRRFKNIIFPIAIAIFINFDHLMQSMFWGGNFNQIFGLVFVSLIILILGAKNDFSKFKVRDYLLIFVLTAVSYKFHNLSFLFIGLMLYLLLQWFVLKKSKVLYAVLILLSAVVLPILFVKSPGNFNLYEFKFTIDGAFFSGLGNVVIEVLLSIFALGGLLFVARKWKSPVLVVFSILSLFLSSAGNGTPGFYPERFYIYLSIAFVILCFVFIEQLIMILSDSRVLMTFCVSGILFAVVPMLILSSLTLRTIYKSEEALPARIPNEDVQAMDWIKENTPKDSIIGGPFKWSEYVPVLADRRVIYYPDSVINIPFPDFRENLDKLFTASDSEAAYKSARFLDINYILWEYQLNESKNPYYLRINYKNNFNDSNLFEKVYDKDSVQIYKVK